MKRGPFSDDDLHAWADGRLAPEHRAAVEAWMAEAPARLARATTWRADSTRLHAAFDPILDESIPSRLRAAAAQRPPRRTLRAAAAIAWLAIGGLGGTGVGYQLGRPSTSPPSASLAPLPQPAVQHLPREAAIAHAVYVPEVRHPVEVDAEQEQHLITWLSKRLGAPLAIPDLTENGYRLLGGRLLPGQNGPGAQFMYEDTSGGRVTLYVSVSEQDSEATAFRFTQQGEVSVFYWVDGRFGYALSAQLAREQLLPLATRVHHQISP